MNTRRTHIIFASIAIVFMLVAASFVIFRDHTQSRSFKRVNRSAEMVQTYYFEGDIVLRQVAVSRQSYTVLRVSNKEQAERYFLPLNTLFNAIKGVDDKMEFYDTYLIHTRTLDLTVMGGKELRELQQAEGVTISGDSDTQITMSESEEQLLASGYQEIK